jgi:hypothetical protein
MMDHTSLVRNVEKHKTYAMDPKELSEFRTNPSTTTNRQCIFLEWRCPPLQGKNQLRYS